MGQADSTYSSYCRSEGGFAPVEEGGSLDFRCHGFADQQQLFLAPAGFYAGHLSNVKMNPPASEIGT